jgi:hypothetical protein
MYLFVVNGNINGYGAGMDLNTNAGLGDGFPGQGGGDFNNGFGGNMYGPGGFGGNLNGQGGFQGGFY